MNQLSKAFSVAGFKDKAAAFLIHAGMTLPFFVGLVVVVKKIWYPDFYYPTQSVQGFLLVVFLVDVVLGPLLTFVVYKKDKPSLKFDIGIIVLLQLAVLYYGVSIVYKERPLYLVFNASYFVVVPANAIDQDAVTFPELKEDLPRIIGTDQPESRQEKSEIMLGVMEGGPDIQHLPHLYRPIAKLRYALDKKGIALEDLPTTIAAEISQRWPARDQSGLRVYAFVPEKTHDQLLVWDLENETMVGLIDTDPWAVIKAARR